MKGKKSSHYRKVINAFKNVENKGNLVVVDINENFTSKNCIKCETQSIDNININNIKLHKVLYCTNC
ncbi:unnamed protein product [Cunninghamella blakesleeana]